MTKDQFYNNFTYSCYKYAPESFLLFYQGKKVKLDRYAAADFGNCLICKGKQELLKLLKRWIRSESNLSQKINNKKILAIQTADNGYVYIKNPYGLGIVDIYDPAEKLKIYKLIKQSGGDTGIIKQEGVQDKTGSFQQTQKTKVKSMLINKILWCTLEAY